MTLGSWSGGNKFLEALMCHSELTEVVAQMVILG